MIKDFANQEYQSKMKIKKDYNIRGFVNPYFGNKKPEGKKGGFNTKKYLKILAVIFLAYLVIYSDLFKVKTIEVNGTDMIDKAELKQLISDQISHRRWLILPQDNLLFLSKRQIVSKINVQYALADLKIDRGWHKLTINIVEKVSYLIVYNKQKFFFADNRGVITKEITQEEATRYWTKFPILNVSRDTNIGDTIVSEKMVSYILQLNEKIKALGIEINGFENEEEFGAILVAKAGWRAKFDINSDLDLAIENMQIVLKEKIKDLNNLQYIDLRFGNKVFYK